VNSSIIVGADKFDPGILRTRNFVWDVDISASPHPLHDVGSSSHGAYLVELPGHRMAKRIGKRLRW